VKRERGEKGKGETVPWGRKKVPFLTKVTQFLNKGENVAVPFPRWAPKEVGKRGKPKRSLLWSTHGGVGFRPPKTGKGGGKRGEKTQRKSTRIAKKGKKKKSVCPVCCLREKRKGKKKERRRVNSVNAVEKKGKMENRKLNVQFRHGGKTGGKGGRKEAYREVRTRHE